jgi:hypothetical protein
MSQKSSESVKDIYVTILKGHSVMTNDLRSEQQVSSSSQGVISCKSLGQPGFYSLIWAHKVRFPRGEVSSNPKKKRKKIYMLPKQAL